MLHSLWGPGWRNTPYLCAFVAEKKREMAGHTDGFETFPQNSITFIYKFHSHVIGQSLVRMGRETSSDRKGEEIIGNNITRYSPHSFPKYSLPSLQTQKAFIPSPRKTLGSPTQGQWKTQDLESQDVGDFSWSEDIWAYGDKSPSPATMHTRV